MKERLAAWKGILGSKGWRVYVNKTKLMISSENAGKITMKGNFPCAVCKKGLESNFIVCQF